MKQSSAILIYYDNKVTRIAEYHIFWPQVSYFSTQPSPFLTQNLAFQELWASWLIVNAAYNGYLFMNEWLLIFF